MIVCVQLPNFAAAIERRAAATMASRPLLLSVRDHVYACSEEVAQCGVQPGMPLRPARALCPEAQVLPARPPQYAQALTPITSTLTNYGEQVETEDAFQTATCYLDIGEVSRKTALDMATDVGRTIRRESELPPTVGVAQGKFPSKVAASLARSNHTRFVAPGSEAQLLAPLPVAALPLDGDIARRLHLFGIETVGQFAALPSGAVLTQFGVTGQRLHRLAQGRDERAVRARVSRPSEQVVVHFDDAITSRLILDDCVRLLAQQLSARLQARVMAATTLLLTLGLEDRARRERRRRLREPLVNAEALSRALRGLLQQMGAHCGVVSLQVVVTDFVPLASAGRQLSLFEMHHEAHLEDALPQLVERYGPDRFYHIYPDEPGAHFIERRYRFEARGAA
jgi:DNA polymerase-4